MTSMMIAKSDIMSHTEPVVSPQTSSSIHTAQFHRPVSQRSINMAISVRLDDDFVADAKIHAEAKSRSVPKQIEHWAKIGRIAEDNPDLPYSFIEELLLAQAEVENSKVSRYVRKTKRD